MKRRFQFRLRTLLLAVTVAAVICAVCLPMLREWLRPKRVSKPWLRINALGPASLYRGPTVPRSKGAPVTIPDGRLPTYAGDVR